MTPKKKKKKKKQYNPFPWAPQSSFVILLGNVAFPDLKTNSLYTKWEQRFYEQLKVGNINNKETKKGTFGSNIYKQGTTI